MYFQFDSLSPFREFKNATGMRVIRSSLFVIGYKGFSFVKNEFISQSIQNVFKKNLWLVKFWSCWRFLVAWHALFNQKGTMTANSLLLACVHSCITVTSIELLWKCNFNNSHKQHSCRLPRYKNPFSIHLIRLFSYW